MLKTKKYIFRWLGFTSLILAQLPLIAVSAQESAEELEKIEPMLPIHKDPPRYPRPAFEQNIEGWVHAQFVVLKDGTVEKDSIVVLDEEPKELQTHSINRVFLSYDSAAAWLESQRNKFS